MTGIHPLLWLFIALLAAHATVTAARMNARHFAAINSVVGLTALAIAIIELIGGSLP